MPDEYGFKLYEENEFPLAYRYCTSLDPAQPFPLAKASGNLMNETNEPIQGELILYQTDEGLVKIEVHYEDETFWLSQKRMAELFGVEVNTINYHLKEIFKTFELTEDSVIRKIRITAADGKEYLINPVQSRRDNFGRLSRQ